MTYDCDWDDCPHGPKCLNGKPRPPEPPSLGSRRVMIYRTNRHAQTECLGCGLSTVACAANRAHNSQPCCDVCRHEYE
jgi:hypothetical protein